MVASDTDTTKEELDKQRAILGEKTEGATFFCGHLETYEGFRRQKRWQKTKSQNRKFYFLQSLKSVPLDNDKNDNEHVFQIARFPPFVHGSRSWPRYCEIRPRKRSSRVTRFCTNFTRK